MKTTPKKKETSLRLRESRREEQKPQTSQQAQDEDADSDLPIRGRPSKKLLIQQQQQRQYQVKLEPNVKAVTAGATAKTSSSSSSALVIGARIKARRVLYKKSVGSGSVQKAPGESYVMRLFERSLDLSKYQDGTPLYPICRAWMANQPRNPAVAAFQTDGSTMAPKREDNGEEILSKLRSGEMKMLTELPQPKPTNLPIIPPRLEFSQEDKKREKALVGADAHELLSSNVARWKKVRGHWLKHAQKYEHDRYNLIDQIMNVVCKN